MYLENVIESW